MSHIPSGMKSYLKSILLPSLILFMVLVCFMSFYDPTIRPSVPCRKNIVPSYANLNGFADEFKPFMSLGHNLSVYTLHEVHVREYHSKYRDNGTNDIYDQAFIDKVYFNNSQPFVNVYGSDLSSLQPVPGFKNVITSVRMYLKYKIASCVVPKTMSTLTGAVQCFLRHPFQKFANYPFCDKQQSHVSLSVGKENMGIHTFDGWDLLFVKRDPIDRFISGFMDRCVRIGRDCYGCYTNIQCYIERLHEALYQFAYDQKKLSYDEYHLTPQTWSCDMPRNWQNIRFIRYSSDPSEKLWQDLKVILEKEKVPADQQETIAKGLMEQRTDHATFDSPLRKFYQDIIMNSDRNRQLLRLIYNSDYETLKFN